MLESACDEEPLVLIELAPVEFIHVPSHPHARTKLDAHSGFFFNLTSGGILVRLAQLKSATGRDPPPVILVVLCLK